VRVSWPAGGHRPADDRTGVLRPGASGRPRRGRADHGPTPDDRRIPPPWRTDRPLRHRCAAGRKLLPCLAEGPATGGEGAGGHGLAEVPRRKAAILVITARESRARRPRPRSLRQLSPPFGP